MTKRVSTATSFNPATSVVDASGISGFDPQLVLAIFNTSAANRATIYDFVTPGYGYTSVSGSQMTVEADTSAMSAEDGIMIVWDDGQSVQSALSPQTLALGLAALSAEQLQPMAQSIFAAIANVQQGGSIPTSGQVFINSDGFVVLAQ